MKITTRTLTKSFHSGPILHEAGTQLAGVLLPDGLYVSNFHGEGKGECIPMRYFDESVDAVVML